MVERLATGIKGFDSLVDGGFPKGSITLVSGNPGTCKSIFCMQASFNISLKGVPVLYVSFEQKEDDLIDQLDQLGYKMAKTKGLLKFLNLQPEDPQVMKKVLDEAKAMKAKMIIVDSLASLTSGPSKPEGQNYTATQILDSVIPVPLDSESLSRMKVKMIFDAIKQTGATALLTSEIIHGKDGFSRDTISEFLCDGIIMMDAVTLGKNLNRTIEVKKMRQTKIQGGKFDLQFGKAGVEIGE